MTTVSILGEKIFIDGKPTYPGRMYEGMPIEGLLFNVRAVQATFDDANPETRKLWTYPDTNEWDPDRNTDDFIAALPEWKAHGVLGFTLNFQGGGSRYIPEVYDTYVNNGFSDNGDLLPAYVDRMTRILSRADELGMVVILGLFYWKQTIKMNGEQAVWNAVENTLNWLHSTGLRNVIVEIANETDIHFTEMPIFHLDKCGRMIYHFKDRYPEFLISSSYVIGWQLKHGTEVTDEYLRAVDFILPHGNMLRDDVLGRELDVLRNRDIFKLNPKPILINEDSTGIPNLEASWRRYVSWGYFDQGYNGEARAHDLWVPELPYPPRETNIANLSGFQTLPVNWTINTPRKKAFFDRVAEITGAK